MRIGTWNVAAHWSADQRDFLGELGCDVWLLTELPVHAEAAGLQMFRSHGVNAVGVSWAAVGLPLDAAEVPEVPVGSAGGYWGGVQYVCSVLPWRDSQRWMPLQGADQGERTQQLLAELPVSADRSYVWGGDWNHEMLGLLTVGSRRGRAAICSLLERQRMQVPTSVLGAAGGGFSIDHVAVPDSWVVTRVERHVAATSGGRRLSDHDAYVVQADPEART